MDEQSNKRLAFSPTQQELYNVLIDERAEIAIYYQAAIAVINDDLLPDRIGLAAHALRELMEKLPNDASTVDEGADVNTKINALRGPWNDAVAEDTARGGDRWDNGIGAALRTFLQAVTEFFQGRAGIGNARRQRVIAYLNQLEVGITPLPQDVQEKNAKQWMDLRRYFNDVAHHRFSASDHDFLEQVAELEAFLYTRLIPRPTKDFARIESLVQEE